MVLITHSFLQAYPKKDIVDPNAAVCVIVGSGTEEVNTWAMSILRSYRGEIKPAHCFLALEMSLAQIVGEVGLWYNCGLPATCTVGL